MTEIHIHTKVCDHCGKLVVSEVNGKRVGEAVKFSSGLIDIPVDSIPTQDVDICPTCQKGNELSIDDFIDRNIAIAKIEAIVCKSLPSRITNVTSEGIHEVDESEGST